MTTSESIWLGEQAFDHVPMAPEGRYLDIDGEPFYCIENVDGMDEFFISLVSATNHWLFISTSGGLTAGRIHSGNALFPYYTEDKVRDSANVTGHCAVFLVSQGEKTLYWEPFARHFDGAYAIQRNLYKNNLSSTLIFEEINHDIGLTYRYAWQLSHRYGFVKRSWLQQDRNEATTIRLLDGVQNLLPHGVTPGTQNELSCLVDAYKKNELDVESGVATYTMSSRLTDKAEPSEALSATTAWSYGLDAPLYLLSSLQVSAFRKGRQIQSELDVHGRRGAYFVSAQLTLSAGEERAWGIVADVDQGPAAVANLIAGVNNLSCTRASVEADIREGHAELRSIIGSADGFQVTSEPQSAVHHTANVLFNVMRGGLYDCNYRLPTRDFLDFCRVWNVPASSKVAALIAPLPDHVDYLELREVVEMADDPLLFRLFLEYLPLTFSRRHGDPSRPWNQFSIDVVTADGDKSLAYAGNWRDIFQNWEALSASAPGFIENIICKFVSASTPDGYNPYRITKEGIDWEKPEPENPWANIGYWGDHQIIYLCKLIELSQTYFPDALVALLQRDVFAYANVPYRLKGFDALIENPYDTIEFDHALDDDIARLVEEVGSDGRLVWCEQKVYQVNLLEKLLVTSLAKLTNFIPGGGIWMNTQRPEWNDANNALVGTGVSVVTLCYLHRFLLSVGTLLEQSAAKSCLISVEVIALFERLEAIFAQHGGALCEATVSNTVRFEVMEQLGRAGEAYRDTLYLQGFSGRRGPLELSRVQAFVSHCLPILERSIHDNQREDGLFHAYNRIQVTDSAASLKHLDQMLEGQVAALSAKVLSADESLRVLRALRESDLFTAEQHSYLLYPNKVLPRFTAKNSIAASSIESLPLLGRLLAMRDSRVVETDASGNVYFCGQLTKMEDVGLALDALTQDGMEVSDTDRERLCQLFVDTFDHDLFTGRSGGMYAYEGIGSIYWHMVSKLLLAASETVLDASRAGVTGQTVEALKASYEDIRGGIGFNKTPAQYGAFPTDPYSHTPGFTGARQPGMTGQVKEEVLTRLAELGVTVQNGSIVFEPILVRTQEILTASAVLDYYDVSGQRRGLKVSPRQLGFTFCQVPVLLQVGREASMRAKMSDGSESVHGGNRLSQALSYSIFMKRGEVSQLTVTLAS